MPKQTVKTAIRGLDGTILSRQGEHKSTLVIISGADVTADAQGNKIVPKGTLVGSAVADQTVLGDNARAKPVNGAGAEGLTMNEVDVTHGDMEVAMLYAGTVGLDRIPAAPAAEARAALPGVFFTKD